MPPSLTVAVVVPFLNSSATLHRCLSAIGQLDPSPHRVLAVDDGSTDRSTEIARSFPCELIRNPQNLGGSGSKNAALKHIHEDLVVFIDSDVIVPSSTLEVITRWFVAHRELACFTAVPAAANSYSNFASCYKAIYMNEVLSSSKGWTDFSHGCLQAFRVEILKRHGHLFSRDFRPDDVNMGLTLSRAGHSIYLSDEILPIHERAYSCSGLLKKAFMVPCEFARLMVFHRQVGRSIRRGRFAHASAFQLGSIALCVLSVLLLLLGSGAWQWGGAAACALASPLLRVDFFKHCYRLRGARFTLQAAAFSYVDSLTMASGLLAGLLLGFTLTKPRRIWKGY